VKSFEKPRAVERTCFYRISLSVHDGQAHGKGIAEEALRRLKERGAIDVLFEAIERASRTI
jgi:hypothetical protein